MLEILYMLKNPAFPLATNKFTNYIAALKVNPTEYREIQDRSL